MTSQIKFVRMTLAQQVAQNFREMIMNNEFSKAPNFPSSRLLAHIYGVSHNVMLKVLKQLQDEGLIFLNSKREGYRLR